MLLWQRQNPKLDPTVANGAPQPDPYPAAAIAAWNRMGGQLEWASLEIMVALLSVEEDLERWLNAILYIRTQQTTSHGDDSTPGPEE